MSAIATRSVDELARVAKAYAGSGFFPDARSVEQAFVKIEFGNSIGLPALVSMNELHIIKGKPSLGAGAIAGLVKAHPRYDYRIVNHDETECVLEFFQDGQSVGLSTFTMTDAETAGLLKSNPTYTTYPRNMLFARAISNGAAWYCPDVMMGRVYVPGEIDDDTPPARNGPIVSVNPDTGVILEIDETGEATVTTPPSEEPAEFEGAPTTPLEPDPDASRKKMFATMRDIGLGEGLSDREKRDLRLAYLSHVCRRPVTTSNDLTKHEISLVIDALEQDKLALAAGARTILDDVVERLDVHYNEFPKGFGDE